MSATSGSFDALSSALLTPLREGCEGKVIASPQTTEEVAAIARYASERKLPVEIAGAGTKRGWGNSVESRIVLDMTGLSGVREHVWQDLTTTVAAGTVWNGLQRALAIQSQRVALDPLWPETATVGGVIASNDSGALRTRYGSLRDLIIGMTVVLADGTIARTGGKVVKNVAGYDLHKLMTGAFGTLGVIAEVTFRLHPMPKSCANWTVLAEDIGALEHVRARLGDSPASFKALQMRTHGEGFALDVALVSLPECMEDLSEKLRGYASPLSVIAVAPDVWSARERCFVEEKATVKITTSSSLLGTMLSGIRSMGGEGVIQQCGIMTAAVPADAELISSLRKQAVSDGGSLTVMRWPGDIVPRPNVWGAPGNSFALMQEIKRQFDPNRILNPGRFVGGL